MARGVSGPAYRELVEEVRDCIRAHVPPGAVVLIASKGDDDLVRIDGYRAWHFPRDEWGSYAGHHPASSAEAIGHLASLHTLGARYLVFPATSAWWLDHYRELANLLDADHRVVVSQEDVCVIYELRDSPVFDAMESTAEPEDQFALDGCASGAALRLVGPESRTTGRPMRVLSILARYGSEQYQEAEEKLTALFSRRLKGIQRHTIVVDNALPPHRVAERDDSVLIGGDNSSREFSAFDRALAFVGADVWSYDFVHCVTSAFNELYVAYLERFEPAVLQALTGRAACVGHIDCYNEPIQVRSYRAQHWMRSGFFFLPPAEVMALGSFVSVADGAPFFSGRPDRPFRDDAPIGPRYRDYISQWLTGEGLGQGVEWHSRFTLSPETLPRFEEKARAILNEQLLSIRLEALGCQLVDVTWLSTMLRQRDPVDVPWSTPWNEQLANRDRDALVLGDRPLAPAVSAG